MPLRRCDAGDLIPFIGAVLGELLLPAIHDLLVARSAGTGAPTFVFEFQDGADGFVAADLPCLREQLVTPPLDDPLVPLDHMEQLPSPPQGLIAPEADAVTISGIELDQQQPLDQPETPVRSIDPLGAANHLDLGGHVRLVDAVKVALAQGFVDHTLILGLARGRLGHESRGTGGPPSI